MSETWEPDPRRWRILAVALLVGFMSLLDVTIVNIAIPSMKVGLDTSTGTIQWVVSGYALAFGMTLVAGGRLGDAYGRRRLMLIGLAGFIASSAAVGLAPDARWVIVARLTQGLAAGLLSPQNSGLIQQLFRGPERGRAFGLFGMTVSLSSALGPVLGGVILQVAGEESGWRWLFLVNVPIGIVGLVAIARVVPARLDAEQPDRPSRSTRLDVVGTLLLGGAVLCVLLPLIALEGGDRLPLLLLVLAAGLAWGFVRWERRIVRRGGAPVLDVGLLRRTPGYAGGLAVQTLYFTGFTGVFLVLSIFLQEGLHRGPLATGLLITPFAVGAAVTSPVAGRLVARFERRLTLVALGVMMTGVLAAALLVPGHDTGTLAWVLVPCLLVAGLGGGGVITPNITLSLDQVPPTMGGAAGGALQTGARVGSALGAALLVTAYEMGGPHPGDALRLALLTALAVLVLALATVVRDLRYRRTSAAREPQPTRVSSV